MTSLAMMFPVWLMSLSMFHFTVVMNRFQQGFDALTPSVIQRLVTHQIIQDQVQVTIEPTAMATGITDFLSLQFSHRLHPYQLSFQFFHQDQITICSIRCKGVQTTISFSLYLQTFGFSRHYQLIQS
jgi:hypothetical protein